MSTCLGAPSRHTLPHSKGPRVMPQVLEWARRARAVWEARGVRRWARVTMLLAAAPAALGGVLFPAGSARAQPCVPQVARLLGTGEAGPGQLGTSIALSADGATLLVGAPGDNTPTLGAAYVFVRSAGLWTQQGPKLVPTGGVGTDQFGNSVALSADGNTAVVGAYTDDNNTGAAFIFVRSGTTWMQQGPKLFPPNAVSNGEFGSSVALSADGNTTVIGAPLDSGTGAAYVFVRSGGVWTQQARVLPTGGSGAGAFGASAALNANASTAIIGANADNGAIGAAYIFVRSGTAWAQQGPKLTPTGGVGAGQFGGSCSLGSDGNTAMVGALRDNSGVGAAYVFVRSGITWSQQGAKLTPTGGVGMGQFGISLSLSGDGNTAVIGANFDASGIGAAYLFARSGVVWSQQGPKLAHTGGVGAVQDFGYSSSLSADTSTVAVGALADTSLNGAAYVFGLNPSIAITQQPAGATVTAGGTAVFTVAASSVAPLSYQWRRNGANLSNGPTGSGSVISGATGPTLTIASAALADSASAFDCIVSNACGSATSFPAGLCVGFACLADFNHDGVVNSQDFFDFLTAFFAGCP
jgi:hypothetical protein